MFSIAKKLIDFLFYSNLYIALCALAMTWQTYLLMGQSLRFGFVEGLIFSATLLTYALHRLVGLVTVSDFLGVERFKVIKSYRHHIWIYAGLSLLGSLFCFWMAPWRVQLALLLPGVVSLAYVLPVLSFGKRSFFRLRDVHFIKIFLIAIVWAYVTVGLPLIDMGKLDWQHIPLLLERALFIFAITLPFDIRDLNVDKHTNVRTIPATIGLRRTLYLAVICLFGFLLLTFINYPPMTNPVFWALLLSAVSTYVIIHFSPNQQHDYYFTGLTDGTMILQFGLVWAAISL